MDNDLDIALERMPQKGPMRLIGRILHADGGRIDCLAKPHGGRDYPLRIDGRLHAVALVELGAQAAAAHASLFGMGNHHTGLLLSLHGLEVAAQEVPEAVDRLEASAIQMHFEETVARYRFEVRAQTKMLLGGEAMLKMERAGT